MIAALHEEGMQETAEMARQVAGKEAIATCQMDLRVRESLAEALRGTVLTFGGLDGIVNTAAVFLPPDTNGTLSDEKWKLTFDINITGK